MPASRRCAVPVLALPAQPSPPLSSMEQEYLERKLRGAEKVLAANPAVRLHWMENAIHDIPLQQPQALAGSHPGLRALPSRLETDQLDTHSIAREDNIHRRAAESAETEDYRYKLCVLCASAVRLFLCMIRYK